MISANLAEAGSSKKNALPHASPSRPRPRRSRPVPRLERVLKARNVTDVYGEEESVTPVFVQIGSRGAHVGTKFLCLRNFIEPLQEPRSRDVGAKSAMTHQSSSRSEPGPRMAGRHEGPRSGPRADPSQPGRPSGCAMNMLSCPMMRTWAQAFRGSSRQRGTPSPDRLPAREAARYAPCDDQRGSWRGGRAKCGRRREAAFD